MFGTVTIQTPDNPPPAPVVQPAVATNNDPAPSQGGQNLAVTGTSSSLALLGLGAVLFGLAATGAARRRQAEA